jgi:hypothetical protein
MSWLRIKVNLNEDLWPDDSYQNNLASASTIVIPETAKNILPMIKYSKESTSFDWFRQSTDR